MGAGAGRGQLGVWQTDKLWTQPQGVQVSPPLVLSSWVWVWSAVGSPCGDPPEQQHIGGHSVALVCVSGMAKRRSPGQGSDGGPPGGFQGRGQTSWAPPSLSPYVVLLPGVGRTGHSSQLACSVGQAVPLLHPEWPGFWGNHLPFGSYQFHHRSRGSGPQGPPWACW